MHRAVVSLPDGLACAGALARSASSARAAGLRVADGRARAAARPDAGISRRAAALLARTEELGGAGRTSTGASRPRPRRSRRARRRSTTSCSRCARRRRRPASSLRPPIPGGARFAVALTHDIDTPVALEQARAARRRRPGSRHALAARRRRTPRASRPPGWRSRRCTGCVGSDPNWSHRRFAASRAPARLPLDLLRARGASRPARRRRARRPTPRAARGSWRELDRLGLEVGLHASYTCLADERPARRASARCSRGLLGGPIAGNRHHYLRLPWHDGHPRARPPRLLLRHDARLRGAARAARRALVPVPALGRRRRGAAAHPRAAARADGRDAGRGALPRALARGGLGRGRARARPPARRAAAARASSGTTTASTASTGAAGTGSTSACSTASPRAAATPARRAR